MLDVNKDGELSEEEKKNAAAVIERIRKHYVIGLEVRVEVEIQRLLSVYSPLPAVYGSRGGGIVLALAVTRRHCRFCCYKNRPTRRLQGSGCISVTASLWTVCTRTTATPWSATRSAAVVLQAQARRRRGRRTRRRARSATC